MEIIFRYVNDIIFTCSLLGKIQLSIRSQQVIAEANWDIVSCSRPSEDRTIPLNIIAERTKLSVEDVEYLLMKSLSVSPWFLKFVLVKCLKFVLSIYYLISFLFFRSGHCFIVLSICYQVTFNMEVSHNPS